MEIIREGYYILFYAPNLRDGNSNNSNKLFRLCNTIRVMPVIPMYYVASGIKFANMVTRPPLPLYFDANIYILNMPPI